MNEWVKMTAVIRGCNDSRAGLGRKRERMIQSTFLKAFDLSTSVPGRPSRPVLPRSEKKCSKCSKDLKIEYHGTLSLVLWKRRPSYLASWSRDADHRPSAKCHRQTVRGDARSRVECSSWLCGGCMAVELQYPPRGGVPTRHGGP
jgi:hypothetical protein